MTKWISIKDRLPECQSGFKKLLIQSYSHERKTKSVTTCDFRNGKFYECCGEDEILIDDGYWMITHWSELPEPPEVE